MAAVRVAHLRRWLAGPAVDLASNQQTMRWSSGAQSESLVDQMVAFTRSPEQRSNPTMAQDILEGGIRQCDGDPVASCRLNAALSELHAFQSQWKLAALRATAAIEQAQLPTSRPGEESPVAGPSAAVRQQALMHGLWTRHVALVALGQDDLALSNAATAVEAVQRGMESAGGAMEIGLVSLERAGAVALRGMHAHALALHGEVGRAKEELSQALTPGVDRTDSIVGSKLDELLPELPSGALALLGGLMTVANPDVSGIAGVDLIQMEAKRAKASLDAGPSPVAVLGSERALRAALAEAGASLAQVHMRQREWAEAEACLEWALENAERAYGDKHPSTGLVLALTAWMCVQTQRFAVAESLFLKAGKLMGMHLEDFMHGQDSRVYVGLVSHRSAGAFVLHRYGDMLSLIQQRAHHGERLHNLADALWTEQGNTKAPPLKDALPKATSPASRPHRALLRLTEQRLLVAFPLPLFEPPLA